MRPLLPIAGWAGAFALGCASAPAVGPTSAETGASAETPAMNDASPAPPRAAGDPSPTLDDEIAREIERERAGTDEVTERPSSDDAQPRHPFQEPLGPAALEADAPAMRYANLSPIQCRALLEKRDLPVERAGPARGIANPVRVTGPMNGVTIVAPGKRFPWGKLDCRLALTLDDFTRVLAEHGIDEIRIDNMYRPGAHLPGSRKSSQHRYGLAIDIVAFRFQGGGYLMVEEHWHATPGETACGPDANMSDPFDYTIRLRNLVCDVTRRGIFHHLLTPSYDAAHVNHFHFDIKRDAKRTVVR